MQLMTMKCEAMLFDLDGVLVDSAECVRRICTDWAVSRGLDPEYVIRWSQGRRVQDTVRAVAPHLDFDAEVAALVGMEVNATDGLHHVPGSRALIESLPPNRWAVVTSGARAVATLRLSHVGLPIPQTLITADDVQRGKPDPEGYLAAARSLGFSPADCVVVEDAPAGIAAAKAAGIRSIGIVGTVPAVELDGADLILDSLSSIRVRISSSGPRLALSADV